MRAYRSLEWRNGVIRMQDQRLLPDRTAYIDYTDYRDVAGAIKDMVVRGAPAIGAAAYGLARVPEMLELYGREVIFLIGGGLHTHGPDLVKNCRYFRQMVERM
jgi:hypothetical protein